MAFESLSDKLQNVFKGLRSKGRLTEDDVKAALKEVKMALLEADVSFKVVKQFVASVQERAVGEDVLNGLNPGQMVIKIVNEKMTALMGSETTEIALLPINQITVIMMCGLQGAGKTTATAKLAGKLLTRGKRPLLTACDIYRPGAIKQLQINGEKVGVPVFEMGDNHSPVDIAKAAIEHARKNDHNVVILDTAGRLHIDDEMMEELIRIKENVTVHQTILVVDAMTGQDAVTVAGDFNERIGIDGVILSKMDGDARGGAALSVRKITGKPIKFIGSGEKVDALTPFYPERMASRILDMGDILSLVEELQAKVDRKQADKLVDKFKSGQDFDFDDFREQIVQMRNMGGMVHMLDKLPGMSSLPDEVKDKMDDKIIYRKEAIINSMTKKERRNPEIIKASRKKRIADGAGVDVSEVSKLIKEFTQMQHLMKRLKSKGGIRKMLNLVKDLMPAAGFGMPPKQ